MKYLFFVFLSLFANSALAQNVNQKDTVYFLVDTTKSPGETNIKITSERVEYVKDFDFKNPCIVSGKSASFFCNCSDQKKTLSKKVLKRIKLTSLKKLMRLMCTDSTFDEYNNKHVTYFIELDGDHYVMHLVTINRIRFVI